MLDRIRHVRSWSLSIRPFLEALSSSSPLLFLLSAFFEKDFPENFLLLLVGVIILDVVVGRLVEGEVAVVVTVWVLIPDATSLGYLTS